MEPPISSPSSSTSRSESDDEDEVPTTSPNPHPRVLPDELTKNVVFLKCESSAEGGSCDVYLVGTAHVSKESCREVQAIISYLKPQVVFLELCASRASLLNPPTMQVPTISEMFDMWKKKKANTFGILYSWFLSKIADKLETTPGSEFRVAYEEGRSCGAKIILGDRPLQITLQRTWGKMSLWHRAKFVFFTVFQAVFLPSAEELNEMLEEMDNVDMITLIIQELSKEFPTLMETLVHERDVYMSASLLRFAREHSSVVAVMGRGHLPGVQKRWNQPIMEPSIMEFPTKNTRRFSTKILVSLGVAATGLAIASGFYLMGKKR